MSCGQRPLGHHCCTLPLSVHQFLTLFFFSPLRSAPSPHTTHTGLQSPPRLPHHFTFFFLFPPFLYIDIDTPIFISFHSIQPVAVQSAEQEKTAMVMASAIAQGGERPAAAATAAAPPTPPTHDPPHPPSRRPWLRNLFAWRRGASSPANPPPISDTYEDSPGVQRQNAPSSTHDRLRLTVLIAMPDPRRPHADGSAFAGQSKGKERSFDLDYDEDDLPEMTLGMTELPYKDSITTTTKSS